MEYCESFFFHSPVIFVNFMKDIINTEILARELVKFF